MFKQFIKFRDNVKIISITVPLVGSVVLSVNL